MVSLFSQGERFCLRSPEFRPFFLFSSLFHSSNPHHASNVIIAAILLHLHIIWASFCLSSASTFFFLSAAPIVPPYRVAKAFSQLGLTLAVKASVRARLMGRIFIDEGIDMIDAKVVLLFQASHEL